MSIRLLLFSLAFVVLPARADAEAAATPQSLLRQGESQLQAGDMAQALETLQQATAADPGSSLAHTRLGGAQLLHQDYAASIASFQQAISLNVENAEAFLGLALAYLHSARYALARAALEEARRLRPARGKEIDTLLAWIDARLAQ